MRSVSTRKSQADSHIFDEELRKNKYEEAAVVLDEARSDILRFDDKHSDLYIGTQCNAGLITREEAIDLIPQTLDLPYCLTQPIALRDRV